LEALESRLNVGRRQLELVLGHVAVGTGPAVAIQALEAPIEKRAEAASGRLARFTGTRRMRRGLAFRALLRPQHRRQQDEPRGYQP
jgi:mRNA-degrading endonuclease toxin of MazEF toxin-antitoxin module